MYTPAERNLDKVAYEDIRKDVDVAFNDAHDALSVAYYEHWKKGDYSVEFQGYKPADGDTLEQAKALFDKLHGLVFKMHEVKLYEENEKKPSKDVDAKLKASLELVKEGETETRVDKIKSDITSLKGEGLELII